MFRHAERQQHLVCSWDLIQRLGRTAQGSLAVTEPQRRRLEMLGIYLDPLVRHHYHYEVIGSQDIDH